MLAEAERRAPVDGLTYYLTWSSARLPRVGDDVVAVVLSDEASRRPAYTDDVRAVFKCYGGRPRLTRRPQASQLGVVRAAGRCAGSPRPRPSRRRSPRGGCSAAHRSRCTRSRSATGTRSRSTSPPITERAVDVAFAGSVEEPRHGASLTGGLLESPKVVSRRQMLDELRAYEQREPVADARRQDHPRVRRGRPRGRRRLLAPARDTKVCLVPRGGSVETYRWFEAMRVGCVVIGEPMPPFWFYKGSPAIEVTDWRTLPSILERLLARPRRAARAQRRLDRLVEPPPLRGGRRRVRRQPPRALTARGRPLTLDA